jgi:hypothetical protein
MRSRWRSRISHEQNTGNRARPDASESKQTSNRKTFTIHDFDFKCVLASAGMCVGAMAYVMSCDGPFLSLHRSFTTRKCSPVWRREKAGSLHETRYNM